MYIRVDEVHVCTVEPKNCGCGNVPYGVVNPKGAYIVCDECGAETCVFSGNLDEAIEVWNNRW